MIVNEITSGIIAIVIAYLLGSIPTAYIVTRLATGKDIRQLGGGNVGARNVFHEVGRVAGIAVAIFDTGKGVAAVIIAHRLLNVPLFEPQLFTLLAAGAVVVGHIWSVYLKFTGGNGLATSLGVLVIIMPKGLLIVLTLTLVLIIITRNPILSMNISLILVPISAWFLEKSMQLVVFTAVLILIMLFNFLPTFRAALVKAGSAENLSDEVLRRGRGKGGE